MTKDTLQSLQRALNATKVCLIAFSHEFAIFEGGPALRQAEDALEKAHQALRKEIELSPAPAPAPAPGPQPPAQS